MALKLAIQWEDAARRRITEAQARSVLSEIHEQIHGTRLSSPSLAEFVRQWMGRKQGETAAITLAAYRHATTEFVEFLSERSSQPLHYMTPAHIAARTANNKLKIIRSLFQTAWRDGLLTENPAAKVQVLKTADSNRRPFALDELKVLLRVASTEWRGMILAGLYLGNV